jgi:hypothetical protein
VLTSGVSAVATNAGEFVDETAYARGADGAVWSRTFSDGRGEWLPWVSLGGLALGVPGVTTVDSPAAAVVYVRGDDDTLWRRTPNGWGGMGGLLYSDPAGMAPLRGGVTPREEAFVIGQDLAVWEWARNSGWHRIGGQSVHAPTATLLPGGGAALFVVGLDDALWMATRGTPTSDFGAFHRVGGVFTSAPTAAVDSTAPATLDVFGLGADDQLWRLSDVVGGAESWTVTSIP